MSILEPILFYAGLIVLGLLLGHVLDWLDSFLRSHVPYANSVLDAIGYPTKVWRKYTFHYTRLLLPDSLYKLWYRTGIMDIESYRAFQDKGYIKDDLDPEYIQTHDDT